MTELARELLTAVAGEDPVDLAADFTARYPVAVLLDLLGIPLDRVDDAMGACRAMFTGPDGFGRAMATFADLAAAGLTDGRSGLAAELRDRVPAEITRDQLHYLLFGLIFPGQITTDPALGFVLADVLDDGRADAELDDSCARRCATTRPHRSPSGGSPPRRSRSPACTCRRVHPCSSTSSGSAPTRSGRPDRT